MASNVRLLDEALEAVARRECNEVASENASMIASLQSWIRKSPHLSACCDERLMLAFLRRCCFSLETTKRRIDGYYALRNAFPEVLDQRHVSDAICKLLQHGIHIIPAQPVSPLGPRIVISQFVKIDPKTSSPREAFKLLFMMLEMLAIEDDNASVSGLIYVVDCRDVGMEQMLQYDPYLLKKIFILVDQCMPLRFTQIHVVNMRREGQAIFNFVTSFLPAKLPFEFVVHRKAEDLFEFVPREALTIEYGGSNGYHAEAIAHWDKLLTTYKDYFIKDAQFGTNEKLRTGLAKNWEIVDDLAGTSGSFRKLEID